MVEHYETLQCKQSYGSVYQVGRALIQMTIQKDTPASECIYRLIKLWYAEKFSANTT